LRVCVCVSVFVCLYAGLSVVQRSRYYLGGLEEYSAGSSSCWSGGNSG